MPLLDSLKSFIPSYRPERNETFDDVGRNSRPASRFDGGASACQGAVRFVGSEMSALAISLMRRYTTGARRLFQTEIIRSRRMSLDRSLRPQSTLARHRNVLSRAERLDRLIEDDVWDESRSVLGLPKVGNRKIKAARKKAKAEAEETTEDAAADAGEASAT